LEGHTVENSGSGPRGKSRAGRVEEHADLITGIGQRTDCDHILEAVAIEIGYSNAYRIFTDVEAAAVAEIAGPVAPIKPNTPGALVVGDHQVEVAVAIEIADGQCGCPHASGNLFGRAKRAVAVAQANGDTAVVAACAIVRHRNVEGSVLVEISQNYLRWRPAHRQAGRWSDGVR